MGQIIGFAIWFVMTAFSALVAIVQMAGLTVILLGSRNREDGWLDRAASWRVLLSQLPAPFANLFMPLLILAWKSLPAWAQYLLNTPDDPDPAIQGWNGKNKEKQVIWVQNQCGNFWRRVYWLQRNCLYGLTIKLRGPRVDFSSVGYHRVDNSIYASWSNQVLMLRVWRTHVPIINRFLVIYYGWALWRYLKTLNPTVPNKDPELDATKDMGGVPVLTARLQKIDPLAEAT